MFAWWGRAVTRLRWWVLAATVVLGAIGGLWGTGVFGSLTGGGFDDPNSDSSKAVAEITRVFGHQDTDVLVLYSSPTATVDDPAVSVVLEYSTSTSVSWWPNTR